MLLDQTVLVKMGGRNIVYYKSIGYDVKLYDTIEISVGELQDGSHCDVKVKCDYCGNIFSKIYKTLLLERAKSHTKKDCCLNCIKEKTKETMIDKYNVENCMDLPSTINKMKETFLIRYGVDWNTKDEEIKKKASEGQKNMSEEAKKKKREKTESTMLLRYGIKSPFNLEKSRKNLFESINRGSYQQNAIFEILRDYFGEENVYHNFPISNLCLDILLIIDNKKINIEYDSSYWHNPTTDRKRDEYLKSLGYFVFRIKSGKLIPKVDYLICEIKKFFNGSKEYSEMILDDWNEYQYKNGGRNE